MAEFTAKKAAVVFWASIIARAWEDDQFKAELLQDPQGVLQRQGYTFSDAAGEDVVIKVAEATSVDSYAYDPATRTLTLYLPQKPACLSELAFEGKITAGACS